MNIPEYEVYLTGGGAPLEESEYRKLAELSRLLLAAVCGCPEDQLPDEESVQLAICCQVDLLAHRGGTEALLGQTWGRILQQKAGELSVTWENGSAGKAPSVLGIPLAPAALFTLRARGLTSRCMTGRDQT